SNAAQGRAAEQAPISAPRLAGMTARVPVRQPGDQFRRFSGHVQAAIAMAGRDVGDRVADQQKPHGARLAICPVSGILGFTLCSFTPDSLTSAKASIMLAPFSNYPVNEAFERLMAEERAARATRAARPRASLMQRILDFLSGGRPATSRA